MKSAQILTTIINSLHISQYRLEQDINPTNGSTRSTRINDIITGRTKSLSRSTINLILKAHPEINPTFLTTGEGDIFIPGYTPPAAQPIPSIYSANYILDCLQHAYQLTSDHQLAKRCYIPPTTISNMRKNNSKLSDKNISLIINNLDHNLSDEWLKNGTPPMYTDGRPDIISPLYQSPNVITTPATVPDSSAVSPTTDNARLSRLESELQDLKSALHNLTAHIIATPYDQTASTSDQDSDTHIAADPLHPSHPDIL